MSEAAGGAPAAASPRTPLRTRLPPSRGVDDGVVVVPSGDIVSPRTPAAACAATTPYSSPRERAGIMQSPRFSEAENEHVHAHASADTTTAVQYDSDTPRDPQVFTSKYKWLGCCYRSIFRADDTMDKQYFKYMSFTMSLLVAFMDVLLVLAYPAESLGGEFWSTWLALSMAVWPIYAQVRLHVARAWTQYDVTGSLYFAATCVLIPCEIAAGGQMTARWWPWFLIIMNIFTVTNSSRLPTLCLAVSWTAVVQIEQAYSFDLFIDPVGNRTGYVPYVCDCESPPCEQPVGRTIAQFVGIVCIMCLNYKITGSFREKVEEEKALIGRAVNTAEDIAMCLSAFDLEAADALLLGSQRGLPPRLSGAFQHILTNLKMYKPYLPASCLPRGATESDEEEEEAESELKYDGPGPDDSRAWSRLQLQDFDAATDRDTSSDGGSDLACGASTHSASTGGGGAAASANTNVSGNPLMREASMATRSWGAPLPVSPGPGRRASTAFATAAPPTASAGPGTAPHYPLYQANDRLRPRVSKMTLVHCNLHATNRVATNPASLPSVFDMVVGRAVEAFSECSRGTVDLFLGDRIYVTFNATRVCARHASTAVAAAKEYYERVRGAVCGINIAIGTGEVLAGDLGSEVMRRYTFLGDLPTRVWGFERVGRALGVPIICNQRCFGDAHTDHELMQLPLRVRFIKRIPLGSNAKRSGDAVCNGCTEGGLSVDPDRLAEGGWPNEVVHAPPPRSAHDVAAAGGGGGPPIAQLCAPDFDRAVDEAVLACQVLVGDAFDPSSTSLFGGGATSRAPSHASCRDGGVQAPPLHNARAGSGDAAGARTAGNGCAAKPRTRTRTSVEEWMYELDRSPAAQWDRYNECIRMFLKGNAVTPIIETMTTGTGEEPDPRVELLDRVLAQAKRGYEIEQYL